MAPCVSQRPYDALRVALLQLCLERIVSGIGTSFKRAHIAEEAGRRSASERSVGNFHAAQSVPTVPTGSQLPLGQKVMAARSGVTDIKHVVVRELILYAQVPLIDGFILEVFRNVKEQSASVQHGWISDRSHRRAILEVGMRPRRGAKDLIDIWWV